jgi:hypothetical protein
MRTLALALLVLALVPSALAKEDVKAELTSPFPAGALPGAEIELSWRLTSPSGPFGAVGVFVRLVDAAGGAPSDATAPQSNGVFTATVRVPPGGVGSIRIGLHGTSDVFFPLVNDPFSVRRPLHLPTLPRGAACPVSTVDDNAPWPVYRVAPGLGPGPAYPVGLGREATLPLGPADTFGSTVWGGHKVLWFVASSYTGPVLIRGGRLDGPGDVRFDSGNVPPKVLLMPPYAGPRYRASYTRLKSPGCYAYQIDGTSFSTLVVFRAARP